MSTSSKNYQHYILVQQTCDQFKIFWRATNSVLANELLLHEILKTVPFIKGRLPDIGCGEKPYSHVFCSYIDTHIGVDLPKTIHSKHAIDIFANAHHLPFKKDTFDTVLCLQVLEHVERPLEILKEIYTVLEKDGVLILSTPLTYQLHNDPNDFYRFTKQGLIEMVKREAIFNIIYCIGILILFKRVLG